MPKCLYKYINFLLQEILVTAAYLACKVEEFNVSIEQFISNVQGNKERAMDVILNTELLLMQELNFHLSVHNPYRAVEGILVDVKTRYFIYEPRVFGNFLVNTLKQC